MQHHKSLTTHLYTVKNFWENFHGKIISHIDQIVIKVIFLFRNFGDLVGRGNIYKLQNFNFISLFMHFKVYISTTLKKSVSLNYFLEFSPVSLSYRGSKKMTFFGRASSKISATGENSKYLIF